MLQFKALQLLLLTILENSLNYFTRGLVEIVTDCQEETDFFLIKLLYK